MKLINGKKIAEKIEQNIKKSKKTGGLGVILAGDNPASHLYVKLKGKAAKRIGLKFEKAVYPVNANQEKIIKKIKEYNLQNDITGILVQLPLPKHLDTNKIIQAIDPQKDADGYHPENLKKFQNGEFGFLPPVLGAVIEILKNINIDLKEKTVSLISNSDIFPLPYLAYFKKYAKKFNHCTEKKCLLTGDIIITAIGKKHYLKSSFIKKGAIIIDVGITKEKKRVYGDADAASLKDKASYLTPVPGGVGPVTVACLLKNVAKKSPSAGD